MDGLTKNYFRQKEKEKKTMQNHTNDLSGSTLTFLYNLSKSR